MSLSLSVAKNHFADPLTNNTRTHTQLLKLNGKLNIIQHQQWPAEALCGTVQQLCETEQIHYTNTQTCKQVSTL